MKDDFDGRSRRCRVQQVHTLAWGQCERGVKPEATVSMTTVGAGPDGGGTFTTAALAELIEPALREVAVRIGPNSLSILSRGGTVGLSGGEYFDLAHAAARAVIHREGRGQ